MCKFCKEYDTGDGEGVTSLKTRKIKFGILGDGQVELEMNVLQDGAEMTAWFSNEGYNENIGASVKINYCPFCGRRLSEK